jgi:prevent-host-death family protein
MDWHGYEVGRMVGERRMTATEARVHFGEVLRHAKNEGNAVIVERDGHEEVAIISMDEYRRMRSRRLSPDELLAQVARTHALILAELGDRELPPVDQMIAEMRADWDPECDDLS